MGYEWASQEEEEKADKYFKDLDIVIRDKMTVIINEMIRNRGRKRIRNVMKSAKNYWLWEALYFPKKN